MSNTTYYTVPTSSSAGDSDEEIVWNKGNLVYHSGSITGDYGNTSTLESDTNWALTRKSDRYIYNHDAYKIGGENGRDHDGIYMQENSKSGFRPSMGNLTGFSIKCRQDSTAGHSMYLRNVGITMTNDTGGNRKIWASNNISRRDNYDWNRINYTFSTSDIASMSSYYFDRFWVRVSSEGGSLTRTTYVTLGAVKFKWNVGPANASWVLGKRITSPYIRSEQIQSK